MSTSKLSPLYLAICAPFSYTVQDNTTGRSFILHRAISKYSMTYEIDSNNAVSDEILNPPVTDELYEQDILEMVDKGKFSVIPTYLSREQRNNNTGPAELQNVPVYKSATPSVFPALRDKFKTALTKAANSEKLGITFQYKSSESLPSITLTHKDYRYPVADIVIGSYRPTNAVFVKPKTHIKVKDVDKILASLQAVASGLSVAGFHSEIL